MLADCNPSVGHRQFTATTETLSMQRAVFLPVVNRENRRNSARLLGRTSGQNRRVSKSILAQMLTVAS
jgi:hypothetical protein